MPGSVLLARPGVNSNAVRVGTRSAAIAGTNPQTTPAPLDAVRGAGLDATMGPTR